MYKVVDLGPVEDEKEIEEVIERFKLGNFNDAPFNWREINEADFARAMYRLYTPKYIVYKQIQLDPDKPYGERRPLLHCHLYLFHDGTGYATSVDYWKGKVNYYLFGCEHSRVELSPQECREKNIPHYGRMWHVEECTKCGNIDSYDTSD